MASEKAACTANSQEMGEKIAMSNQLAIVRVTMTTLRFAATNCWTTGCDACKIVDVEGIGAIVVVLPVAVVAVWFVLLFSDGDLLFASPPPLHRRN